MSVIEIPGPWETELDAGEIEIDEPYEPDEENA